MDVRLNPTEQRFLLQLARDTIEGRLRGETRGHGNPPRGPLTDIRGAFVTLKSDGALRGCIGHVEGALPLWQTVRDNALAAAFEDPRFPPLSGEELPGLKLEISVLTPLRAITSPGDIEVGRDGLMVTRGWRRGLLLPQVATEQGWDRETFLDHTCQKAGMSPGCWRDPDTTIQVFRAQVFGEE